MLLNSDRSDQIDPGQAHPADVDPAPAPTAPAHKAAARPTQVVGPLGEALTLETLPPPETRRWVVRRKAEVVAAVGGGLLTVEEACERYGLTIEELASWQRAVERSGLAGLRVTRLQTYRELYERRQQF